MRRVVVLVSVVMLFCLSSTQSGVCEQNNIAKRTPELLITYCVDDGFYASLPEYPGREKIADIGDVNVEAGFAKSEGATFWFMRQNKEIFRFTASDLESNSVWIAVDRDRALDDTHDEAHIALTYSDGGAIGGFHVHVFLIDHNGVQDVSRCVDGAVADFKTRHYCKSRGNNVEAPKWIRGALLLWTEVYPTSDCGPDFGHIEGYLVSVPEGRILEHMTLDQLKHYPGICLQNDEEN